MRTGRLWAPAALRSVFAFEVIAFVAIGVGLDGARHEATVAHQEVWMTLAVLGVVLSGAGNGWMLMLARRSVARRRRRLLGSEPPAPPAVATERPDVFVAAQNMTLYHRANCLLAVGKGGATASRTAHGRAGRRPCDWCRP